MLFDAREAPVMLLMTSVVIGRVVQALAVGVPPPVTVKSLAATVAASSTSLEVRVNLIADD